MISHRLAGSFLSAELLPSDLRELLDDWAVSVARFAPEQTTNFDNFRELLSLGLTDRTSLLRALEGLDEGLQGFSSAAAEWLGQSPTAHFPPYPPKGFSRVLIADDEPQPSLINSLTSQYGYEVVGQGFKLSQARELLEKKKPDVVLSDLFFKESLRPTEIADKAIGDRFIQYALTHPQYRNSNPKKPIVLVTSKATVRAETEIRAGAINCSGAGRATDQNFIHGVIWTEAKKRGVINEPEELTKNGWTVAHAGQHRLKQQAQDLPRIIKRWRGFGDILSDTIRLLRSLQKSTDEDPAVVNRILATLEPHGTEEGFSLATVTAILVETEQIRRDVQALPETEYKLQILNILHSKIEQFPTVTNAIKSLLAVNESVAADLQSLPEYQRAAEKIQHTLDGFSLAQPLLPFLMRLQTVLNDLLPELPEPPPPLPLPGSSQRLATSRRVNIVAVEDDEYWSEFITGAVEKLRARLGDEFQISCEYFDNADDALQAIPATSRSFAISNAASSDASTVAIVDICLPEDRAHAERIRAFSSKETDHLEMPHSIHGFNLIRQLCSYYYDVPLVVLSTVNSIADRRAIGSLGVPDHDFLAKGIDDEDSLIRALIRKIEKRAKYVIKRVESENGNRRLLVNGIEIPLSKELSRTMFALIDLHQTSGKSSFAVEEIIRARGDALSGKSKQSIHDHILRIRKLILKALQTNRVYVNIRELLVTGKSSDNDEFTYQLNAEIMPLEDELDYEQDLREYKDKPCRVLVVENNLHTQTEIAEALRQLNYEVAVVDNAEEAVQIANDFRPHIVSLDLQIPYRRPAGPSDENDDSFAGLEAWRQIRLALNTSSVGVVVPTVNVDKDDLVSQAAQMEIPIRSFVSKRDPSWFNYFLKKIADEKKRTYLGEVADFDTDVMEPLVQILDGSDLTSGVLRLVVDGRKFSMKVSPVAKIIGLLLSRPKVTVSFHDAKLVTGSRERVTKDDKKNWTKRIRAIIREKWLSNQGGGNLKELAEKLLQSSTNGLQLNVQVADLRNRGPLK
ncbi:MAG: hypothetical protein WAQ99_11855 [Pyrinomonadaceae bacterium]